MSRKTEQQKSNDKGSKPQPNKNKKNAALDIDQQAAGDSSNPQSTKYEKDRKYGKI